MEVRRKAMSIVLSMTSTRNVEEVVLFLKKQLQRTQDQEYDKVCLSSFVHATLDLHITRRLNTASY
jgi:hypothetical protein